MTIQYHGYTGTEANADLDAIIASVAATRQSSSFTAGTDVDLASTTLGLIFSSGLAKTIGLTRLAGYLARIFGYYVVTDPKFGAVGNGVTNDLPAFNAALAAAPAGSTVVIPPAVTNAYVMSGALVAPNKVLKIMGTRSSAKLLFTGATDGIVVGDGSVVWSAVSLENLLVSTSNAAAKRAVAYNAVNQNGSICCLDIMRESNAAQWTHGFWADDYESSSVIALHIYTAAAVSLRLQNFCNALKFYDLEITGGQPADATFHRGMEIDSTLDPHFFGGTIQGYFSQSCAYVTNGSAPRMYGIHFENTNATPSDGGDYVIDGTACTGGLLIGCEGANMLLGAGTTVVRSWTVIGGGNGAIVLGSASQGCTINCRVGSITDNGAGNTIYGAVNTTGSPLAHKMPGQALGAGTVTVPAAIVSSNVAYLMENGRTLAALTSLAAVMDLLFLSGADGTFLQYLAGKTLTCRNSSGTTRWITTDSGFAIGAAGSTISELKKYAPSLTPAAVAANTIAEQTFTVTGLVAGDNVTVSPPAMTAGIGVLSARASAADTLAITFLNNTAGALTPSAGFYRVTEIR